MACNEGGEISLIACHENGAQPTCRLARLMVNGACCMAHATCHVTLVVAYHRKWRVGRGRVVAEQLLVDEQDVAD